MECAATCRVFPAEQRMCRKFLRLENCERSQKQQTWPEEICRSRKGEGGKQNQLYFTEQRKRITPKLPAEIHMQQLLPKTSKPSRELCAFGQPMFPTFAWASFRQAGFFGQLPLLNPTARQVSVSRLPAVGCCS